MSRTLLDVHTHTVASGHAYSTLQEMAQAAAERHLEVLGITDHAPAVEGAPAKLYFRNLNVVPRQMYGVRLLLGSELNILDERASLDLAPDDLALLDLRIAGIHRLCWKPASADAYVEGYLHAIRNPWVQIISHPADSPFLLDFRPLVEAARETGTLLELNNSTLDPRRGKLTAHDNFCQMLRLCREMEVPVILGSDAHISFSVADYSRALPLLAETDFPDRLVVNYDTALFFRALKPAPAAPEATAAS